MHTCILLHMAFYEYNNFMFRKVAWFVFEFCTRKLKANACVYPWVPCLDGYGALLLHLRQSSSNWHLVIVTPTCESVTTWEKVCTNAFLVWIFDIGCIMLQGFMQNTITLYRHKVMRLRLIIVIYTKIKCIIRMNVHTWFCRDCMFYVRMVKRNKTTTTA